MAEEENVTMESEPTEKEAPVQELDKSEWGEDISPDKDEKVFKKIIKEGVGEATPRKGDEVFVHYTGRLLDGTVFDSSVERNELFSFKLGQGSVIKGWDTGVATMKKGEKCLLTCSPEYAYGEQGSGEKIPPNSTLQFEVELFRWQGEDVTNDGGVIKNIIKEGEGYRKPSEGATVKVLLKGSIGEEVFEEKSIEFCIGEGCEVGVVEGVEKALEKMKKGEEAEVIIQPRYAFGSEGNSELNVPADAVVVYYITLLDFVKVKESYEYDGADDRITDATSIKEKGSGYFKDSKYSLALKVYRRALKIVDKESVHKDEDKEATRPIRVLLRLNIAACLLKIKEANQALKECEAVLEEDSKNIKGLFRKGQALQLVNDYDAAVKCFQEVVKLESGNRAARQQVQVCRDKIKEQREKDKKMYSNIFQKMSALSERDVNKPEQKEADSAAPTAKQEEEPEKDAITEAMEQEEKEDLPPPPKEETVTA